MNKFNSLSDVKCLFCSNIPLCTDKSINYPEYFCKKCKMKLYLRPKFFGSGYVVDRISTGWSYCEKHNKILFNGCSQCQSDAKLSLLKKQNFTKSQLKFIMDAGYGLDDDVKKMLGIKDEDDEDGC